MGDVKKWSVTYTKHINQKRKVYQDGLLELHDSNHKIMLYDDCEKLLVCRVVKNDDVVKSGETLAFDSYLVDIGDLDGDHKTIPNVDLLESDKKITDKAGSIHGHKFKHHAVPIDRKPGSGKKKAPSSSLSPSQKIIREFKKNEMNKYGAPRNCPEPTKASFSEWNVLYTTQIAQKAKKYHDGILRVATCGSQRRQVTLYDVSRRLLDSRFLKKDEVIGSGESLALDGHLVDIGELEGDHKPPVDLKNLGKNFTAGGRTGLSLAQQTQHCSTEIGNSGSSTNVSSPPNNLKAAKASMREWNVLYTSQITQKAKKYHDGILRVASCGYQQRQVTLYDLSRRELDSRFLNRDEVIGSGESLALNGHLVDIGEPEGDQKHPVELRIQGRNCAEGCKTGLSHVQHTQPGRSTEVGKSSKSNSMFPLNCLKAVETPTRGGPLKTACLEKDMDSKFNAIDVANFKLGGVSTGNPLRDASGILSILKKTMTREEPVKSVDVKEGHTLQFSELIQAERHIVREFNADSSNADNKGEETRERLKKETSIPIGSKKSEGGSGANSNDCKSHDPCDSGRQDLEENSSKSKRDEIPSFDLEL